MALTKTFTENSTKHSGKAAGDKHADGGGMYLLVKKTNKYWCMDYRFADKRKTLALGVYPAVSLAKCQRRLNIDPQWVSLRSAATHAAL